MRRNTEYLKPKVEYVKIRISYLAVPVTLILFNIRVTEMVRYEFHLSNFVVG